MGLIMPGMSLGLGALITALVRPDRFILIWLSTSLLLVVSMTVLFALYKKAGSGKLLAWMIFTAFVLRLGLGIFLQVGLPVFGYESEEEKGGYAFYDAYRRDMQAGEVAQSGNPLYTVFTKQYSTDQYGGYLGLSVLTYRYLADGERTPHLMLILSALAAAVGIPFLWMILTKMGKEKWRKFAGWWFVLYPEAVLLGASQMREPYLITMIAMVFWAALEWKQNGFRSSAGWMLAGLLGMLVFSPGIAVLSLVVVAFWVWLDSHDRRVPWWVFPAVGVVVVMGVVVLAYALARQSHFAKDSPLEIIFNWLRNAAAWDLSLTKGASGHLDYQLKALPVWARTPFVIVYGILQPVLPATLMDPAAWVWRIITSLMAAGWYLLLPILIYGTVSVFSEIRSSFGKKMAWLATVIWFWVVLSSTRAGGDLWDNPRYRTIILIFLLIFAAWAWDRAKAHHCLWLKRVAAMEGIFLLFFLQWYAYRYYGFLTKLPFFVMLLWIIVLSALITLGGILYDRIHARDVTKDRPE